MVSKVDYVMDHFDYDKVYRVMEALNWRWIDAEFQVPTVPELREATRKLLVRAINTAHRDQEQVVMATGGFVVTVDPGEDFVSLEFTVERVDNMFMEPGYGVENEDEVIEILVDSLP